jgi:hypothetical protein
VRLGTVTIDRRYRGPWESGNGGYVAGLLAGFAGDEAVEVTLRLPPPLARPLEVMREDDRTLLLDGAQIVAEARPATLTDEPAPAVSFESATAASARYAGFDEHVFPECFVCGPKRRAGDGLRIFPGPVAGSTGLVAAPWLASDVDAAVIWAAIDCPGAFALGMTGRGETLLGRMTARVLRLPDAGERCVAVGEAVGEDGRKLFARTALYGEHGEPLAVATQTWITPRTLGG